MPPYYNNYPYYQTPYQNPYQQSMAAQPMTQQPVQPSMPMQSQSSIIWISGEREAQMYPVAPNNAVTLWSTTEPVVYLKQADASGKPTMKVYDLVERTETPVSGESGKAVSYATKDDLAAVLGAVKGYDGVIGAIKADIDTLKGDIYGLAGKKRTTKKDTEEE